MNRNQRRNLEKARRAMNKKSQKVSPDSWGPYTYNPSAEPKDPPKIPGVTVKPVNPEFDAKVASNLWHDRDELDGFVSLIKKLSEDDSDWTWARNWDCKYVNIRIDMRDGGFVFTSDKGERINLEQLKWQYDSPEDSDEV